MNNYIDMSGWAIFTFKCGVILYCSAMTIIKICDHWEKFKNPPPPSFKVKKVKISKGENQVVAQNRFSELNKTEISRIVKERLSLTHEFAFLGIYKNQYTSKIFFLLIQNRLT